MSYRRITVFGGSGFIGRHLIRRLAKTGATVRVAVRDIEAAGFLRPMGDVGQIVPWHADIRDPKDVAAAVDGAEAVINLVGILYERGLQRFRDIHVEGAGRIAAAAAAAGARRLVHVSALGADRASPSAYARSKAEGEAAVLGAFPSATILRPSVVFGPEDDFFNRFAALARLLPALPVFGCSPRLVRGPKGRLTIDWWGKGGTQMQPVYVGDVAEAILSTLDDPATAGRLYELGGPRVYSFKQLMERVLAETRRRRCLVPLPYCIADLQGAILGLLPVPPLTRDQAKLLRADSVVSGKALDLKALGIAPTAVEAVLPTYMDRYRVRGRFSA